MSFPGSLPVEHFLDNIYVIPEHASAVVTDETLFRPFQAFESEAMADLSSW